MSHLNKRASYLIARDASIPADFSLKNRKMRTHVDRDLREIEEDDSEVDQCKFGVYLRIKPLQTFTDEERKLYKVEDDILLCSVPSDSQTGRSTKDAEQMIRRYTFSKIFLYSATQLLLFNSVVKGKVLRFMNGENSNLLSYGTSGAGKTFTILGTHEAPGIIPRSLEYIFRSISQMTVFPVAKPRAGLNELTWMTPNEQQTEVEQLAHILENSTANFNRELHRQTYREMQHRLSSEPIALLDERPAAISVWVSFAEIYNEQVFDLLDSNRTSLKIYNNNNGMPYINKLKQVYVSNGMDAYSLLQHGLESLNYAATSINDHSSRSHCIFTIILVQSTIAKSADYRVSHMNFCDLAGSERSKKSNNTGNRLNESNNINNSLLVLGRCISTIRENQKRPNSGALAKVPVRDSKLTQIFSKALQGNEDISMIVNINPSRNMFDETIHSLNFSALAKDILVEKSTAIVAKSNPRRYKTIKEYENKISELECEVQHVQDELDEVIFMKDADEDEVRKKLVDSFKMILEEAKQDKSEEMERQLKLRDDIINELHEEIEELKERKSVDQSNNSIIVLDSDDENDLSFRTRNSHARLLERYGEVFTQCQEFKTKSLMLQTEFNESQAKLKMITKQKEDLEKKNTRLCEELQRQKCEILTLQDDCQYLDHQVRTSMSYSNQLAKQYELSKDSTQDSDQHSDE